MKNIHKITALGLSVVMLFTSCASTTTINSTPSNASIYIDGELIGTTPFTHSDTKIVGSTTTIKLEKEGYRDLNTSISRSEEADIGAIIGGCFFLIPFLWTMKYRAVHSYTLSPSNEDFQTPSPNKSNVRQSNQTKSKAERLREIKELLDDKILTQEEYEKEKARILREQE